MRREPVFEPLIIPSLGEKAHGGVVYLTKPQSTTTLQDHAQVITRAKVITRAQGS